MCWEVSGVRAKEHLLASFRICLATPSREEWCTSFPAWFLQERDLCLQFTWHWLRLSFFFNFTRIFFKQDTNVFFNFLNSLWCFEVTRFLKIEVSLEARRCSFQVEFVTKFRVHLLHFWKSVWNFRCSRQAPKLSLFHQ